MGDFGGSQMARGQQSAQAKLTPGGPGAISSNGRTSLCTAPYNFKSIITLSVIQ